MAQVTVKQAFNKVAKDPFFDENEDIFEAPAWRHLGVILFKIANNPNIHERGSLNRSTRARKILLTRMVGKRRAGTPPIVKTQQRLKMVDLTGKELE